MQITDYRHADLDELVAMWRASFEHGVGIVDPHPLEEQAAFFREQVLPAHSVQLARADETIVGFLASNAESVAQLYVRVGHQGRGIGTRLLETAKRESSGRLALYTFARNASARRFYEKHGFIATAHGFEPMWQLEDVRYEWTRPQA